MFNKKRYDIAPDKFFKFMFILSSTILLVIGGVWTLGTHTFKKWVGFIVLFVSYTVFFKILFYSRKLKTRITIKQIERHSVWQWLHIFFGIVLALFFNLIFNKIYSLFFTFLVVIAWEIYEEFQHKMMPSKQFFDTTQDIILAMGFALLVLLLL